MDKETTLPLGPVPESKYGSKLPSLFKTARLLRTLPATALNPPPMTIRPDFATATAFTMLFGPELVGPILGYAVLLRNLCCKVKQISPSFAPGASVAAP